MRATKPTSWFTRFAKATQIMGFVAMSILACILAQAVAPLGGTRVHGGEPAQAATQKYVDAETAQRLYPNCHATAGRDGAFAWPCIR